MVGEQALATGRAAVERIVSGAGIFRAAAAETEMPSEEVPAGTTDRALAPAAVAVPPACGAEALVAAEEVSVVEAAVGGADRALALPKPKFTGAQNEIKKGANESLSRPFWIVGDLPWRVCPPLFFPLHSNRQRRKIQLLLLSTPRLPGDLTLRNRLPTLSSQRPEV